MRIDLFLGLTGVFRTRSTAGKACRSGHVTLNGKRARPSMEVKPGDAISSERPDGVSLTVEVLAVPASKQVPRRDRGLYVSYIGTRGEPPC